MAYKLASAPKTIDFEDQTDSSPKKLATEVRYFLRKLYIKNPEYLKEPEEVRRRIADIIRHAKIFDNSLSFANESVAYPPSVLERLLDVREVVDSSKDITGVIFRHYDSIDTAFSCIIERLQSEGLGYLVDDDGCYRELAMKDFDLFFESVKNSHTKLATSEITKVYPKFTQFDPEEYTLELPQFIRNNPSVNRLYADLLAHNKDTERLEKLLEIIMDGKTSEEIASQFLLITRQIMIHMQNHLFGQIAGIFQKTNDVDSNRTLDYLDEGTLSILEIILDVLVRFTNIIGNMRLQIKLLKI